MTTLAPRFTSDRTAAWALVALGIVSIVGGNLLASLGILGPTTGEVSDANFTIPIVPSGWAFSIWSFIYPALLALTIAQATRWGAVRPSLVRTRLPLAVNLGINLAWLITFAQEWFVINNVLLVAQLATGLWIYAALGRRRESGAWVERFIRVGVSVYAGWLTVATTVGTAGTLYVSGWNGFGIDIVPWTVVLLGVAAAIGLAVRLLQRDPAYGAVFVWAFVAIAVNGDQPDAVFGTALALAALFALALPLPAVWRGWRGGRTAVRR